jgi:adenosylmethionine-8-amino-7-oxononanoate aminotransferase
MEDKIGNRVEDRSPEAKFVVAASRCADEEIIEAICIHFASTSNNTKLDRDCEPVVAAMRDRYILINGTDRTVLRFLPPLIVREEQIRTTIEALRDVMDGMR